MSAMKYYAMVAINKKTDDQGNDLIRRVLISYTHRQGADFCGTKFVEKDKYFYDAGSSHKYEFYDDGYELVGIDKEDGPGESDLINKRRPYHSYYEKPSPYAPILFKASMDIEAIERFNNRREAR